ncbi:hypothetical protein NONO_c23880 [Nocardia nova SH22a]|uniref:Uncharacterized protein n=1 Tax=Nocardia nova SH22a TaxID=1415166 RepID=W5TDD4_9NOCA|nr:hypothetical protein [Nocardia nova]AHH17184.1 hypothetical protein NONO_c23880 [Nocardia nova SH22a]
MRERWRAAAGFGALLIVLIVVVVLGWAQPPRPGAIATDRLGPDSGERVADYLERAEATLPGGDTDPHWALVTLRNGLTTDAVVGAVAGLRVSQVLYHVPLDRVYTPVIVVPVAAGTDAVQAAQPAAAGAMDHVLNSDDRSRRIAAVSAARLRSGCACAVNLVVRGTLAQLRGLAAHEAIRSVEALPPDAAAGTFAVLPLLPGQLDVVAPGPDDGEVPQP